MKTLYYFYCEGTGSGQVFVSSDGELVSYCDANDGEYRSEYHSFIPEYFGGEIKNLDFDLEPPDDSGYIDYGDLEDLLKKHKKQLLKAIKNAK